MSASFKKTYPLVSIIIPCFNYGRFLAEALDSAANQTYPNIEIIIIDDGSTDNSRVVAENYIKTHNKSPVRYLYQTNKGIIETRNRGVRLAKGEYIIQLDADDILDHKYVSETIRTSKRHGVKIVYTDVEIIGRENRRQYFSDFSLDTLKYQNFIHASSLVHTSVFKDLKYDPALDKLGYEDWDIFLGACLNGFTAARNKKVVLYYRKHSAMNSRSDEVSAVYNLLKSRNYIHEKYIKLFPNDMRALEPLVKIHKKILEDNKLHKKVKEDYEYSKSVNKRMANRISSLESTLDKYQSSRAFKICRVVNNFYNKAKGSLRNE